MYTTGKLLTTDTNGDINACKLCFSYVLLLLLIVSVQSLSLNQCYSSTEGKDICALPKSTTFKQTLGKLDLSNLQIGLRQISQFLGKFGLLSRWDSTCREYYYMSDCQCGPHRLLKLNKLTT